MIIFLCIIAAVFIVIVAGTASDGFNDKTHMHLSALICFLIFGCGYFVGALL
jgi:hypothetical protein